jgi:putative SOS response-associated peptidase YedK
MALVVSGVVPWLNADTPLDAIAPLPPEEFVVRPVNRAVNKVGTKDIAAIEAV